MRAESVSKSIETVVGSKAYLQYTHTGKIPAHGIDRAAEDIADAAGSCPKRHSQGQRLQISGHAHLHHLTAVSTPSHHCFPLHPFQQTWLASSAAPRAASLSWSCCRLLSAASASIRQICDRNACPSQSVCCISKTIAILEDNRLTAGELAGFTSACRRGVHFVSLLPGALLELLRSCLGGDKDGSEISSD